MAEKPDSGDTRRVKRWWIVTWSTAALILLLPLIAMQFTGEVVWDVADFVIFGAMLAGVVGAFQLATRKTANAAYKTGAGIALAGAFILFWANGAVGIIGNKDDDANLMYYGVLAVGLIGALLARFEPRGMARAMMATGVAQGLTFVIALVAGWGFTGPTTFVFLAFWLGSARLFQKAALGDPERSAI